MGDIEETKHTKLTWVINNGQNLRSDNTSGIRDLEQAAEHITANTLYQIEVNHVKSVTFDAKMVRELLA